MRVLYLSNLFQGFVHYPILKLQEDFNMEYHVLFFQNKYTLLKDKDYVNHWNRDYLTTALDPDRYTIIKYWGLPKNLLNRFYFFIMYLKIKNKIKKGDFDVIHAHCLHPTGMLAYKMSKKLNIPYVVSSHGIDFYNAVPQNGHSVYNNAIKNQIKKVMTNSYATIAVSERFASDIKSFFNNANVIWSENTFNRDIFKPASIKRTDDYINLLTVGIFRVGKNHMLLLRVLNELREEYPNIRLTLVGAGHLHDSYVKFITENKMTDFVVIKHLMPHHELINEYHASDLFILPSNDEPFGIVCLEALACGIPVIASNTQGPIKIISHNVDGLLFENYSHEDLKEKIKYMLDNPEIWGSFKEQAILKAKQYENKHHEVYNVYKRAIEEFENDK